MAAYVLRRLLGAVPTMFVIVTIAFFMIRLAPGGPFDLERPLDPLIMQNLERAYNFDKPLWHQYLIYLGNLAQGDLGPSFTRRDFSVVDLFRVGLPVSITIGSLSLLIALLVGTVLGA
ncbi:MAG TPA: ABC transporter, partial [Tianweitania sediminis]|nr:ABC transporter [Tianweitania sediminis]